jgi:hypothetical protein
MSGCNFQVRGPGLAALVVLLLASTALGQEVAIRGKCVGVHDGDSCTLLVGNTQIKIRVAFLDAPELGQPFGYRAKQAMRDLVSVRTWQFTRTRFTATEGRSLACTSTDRTRVYKCFGRDLPGVTLVFCLRPPRIFRLATGKRRFLVTPETSRAKRCPALVK